MIIARHLIIFFLTSTTRESLATREPRRRLHGVAPAAAGAGLVVGILRNGAGALLVQLAVPLILALLLELVAPARLGVVALSGAGLGKTGMRSTRPHFLASERGATRDARVRAESGRAIGRADATISTNSPSRTRFHGDGSQHGASAYRTCAAGGKERNEVRRRRRRRRRLSRRADVDLPRRCGESFGRELGQPRPSPHVYE